MKSIDRAPAFSKVDKNMLVITTIFMTKLKGPSRIHDWGIEVFGARLRYNESCINLNKNHNDNETL